MVKVAFAGATAPSTLPRVTGTAAPSSSSMPLRIGKNIMPWPQLDLPSVLVSERNTLQGQQATAKPPAALPFKFRCLAATSTSALCSAPAVVLLPGLVAGSRIWDKSLNEVRAAGHAVIELQDVICDDSGHITGLPELRTRLAATLDAAAASLPELGGQFILCGNSFGGLVAADFAAHFPERAAGVLVSGTPGLGDMAALLPQLTCPVRLVWGQHDKLTPWQDALRTFTNAPAPGVSVTVVEGSGHSPTVEASEGLTSALQDLLSKAHAGGAGEAAGSSAVGTAASGVQRAQHSVQGGFQPISSPRQPAALNVAGYVEAGWRAKRVSGIQFPIALPSVVGPLGQEPMGLGVRTISLLGLKNINSEFCKLATGHAAVDKALLEALIAAHSVRRSTAMVVMSRAMTKSRCLNMIKTALAERLQHVPGSSDTLSEFEAMFADISFQPGTELAFSSSPDGATTVFVDGTELGSVELPAFGDALFDLSLSKEAMSPAAKASAVEGLSALLSIS